MAGTAPPQDEAAVSSGANGDRRRVRETHGSARRGWTSKNGLPDKDRENAPLKEFRLRTIHTAHPHNGKSALVNLCAVIQPLK